MVVENTNEPWENWAASQMVMPFRHCHPTSRADLVTIVQQAEAAGKRVRAVGSSWSFPDIAVTPDFLVETDQLGRVLNNVVPAALNATGKALHLVHVEAGIKVLALCHHLDGLGLALSTMGGADGQSVAGILSTCVHGPDFNRGPIPDFVRAIHLVGPAGVEHWIEASAGISDPAALQAALGSQVTIHQDDDWFNAALVTVGTLGIIYSVVIEAEPQYDIVETIATTGPWQASRSLLVDGGGAFFHADRGTQMVIDVSGSHATALYKRTTMPPTGPGPYSVLTDPLGMYCTGVLEQAMLAIPAALDALGAAILPVLLAIPAGDALVPLLATALAAGEVGAGLLALVVDVVSAAEPAALGDLVASVLNNNPMLTQQVVSSITQGKTVPSTHRGWAHTIMSGPNPGLCATRGIGLEIAFNTLRNDHVNFIDDALDKLDGWFANEGLALAGWFSVRFVGRSRASLSPQNRCDRTCMAEFTGLRGFKSTPILLDRLEALGRAHNGVSHWGMFRNLTRSDVENSYPGLNDWRRIRWQITNNGTLRTFDNNFAERVGLCDPPADLTFLETLLSPPVDLSFLHPLLLEESAHKAPFHRPVFE